jgi:hypothetical protein
MLETTIRSDSELVECHQSHLTSTQSVTMVFVLLTVLVLLSLLSLELGCHHWALSGKPADRDAFGSKELAGSKS